MKWIREANRLNARPGEDQSPTFSLPSHVDANLSPIESAEAIADFYLSKIRQEYTPIEEDISAPWMDVKRKIQHTGDKASLDRCG